MPNREDLAQPDAREQMKPKVKWNYKLDLWLFLFILCCTGALTLALMLTVVPWFIGVAWMGHNWFGV